jgi:hypothetical protein
MGRKIRLRPGKNHDPFAKGGTEMSRTAFWLASISFITLMGCALFFPHGSEPLRPSSGDLLKKACLEAAVKGINTEITRCQEWIDLRKQGQVDDQDLPDLEKAVVALKEDLNKHRTMSPQDYQPPEAVNLKGWVEGKPEENAIFYVEGMSRSGPWYHLAGIKGGEYGILKPGAKYLVSFYKVYPRSYFNMESSYVYIAEYHEIE